ncbi:MAG TPA: hypothetical protein VFY05_09985 [Candidatus Angelobacter sp.]|nr:hypothetical protein [Candidatus Angelobacter sp.]
MKRMMFLLFTVALALSESAMCQTVVENPATSQTINQPSGTSFNVNGVGGLVWPNLFRIGNEGNTMVFRDLSQSNAWYMIMRNDGSSTADVEFFAGFTNGGSITPNPSNTGNVGTDAAPWNRMRATNIVGDTISADTVTATNGSFTFLAKGESSFKIDHPLDPLHKFLFHSVVESPDMKDIYDGIAILDNNGEAWVKLPGWFEALNEDFRYQLTPIGAPGSGLYVSQEVSDNKFKISGGKPGLKVSWQVTGIRHDALANTHRIPVEEVKPAEMQGKYLYPDAFRSQDSSEVAGQKGLSTGTQSPLQELTVADGNR